MSSKFRPSTIDFIITDLVLPHSRPWVLHDFSSDHLPVRFNVYTDTKLKCAAEIPIYKLANWKFFRRYIDDHIGPLQLSSTARSTKEIDLLLDSFNNVIANASKAAIP